MRIKKIDIVNFRGIKTASINISDGAPGRITTIVGLNESGKTTLLEALSNFISLDVDTRSLVETVHSKDDPKTFIPKEKRGRFSDIVSIEATISLSDADIAGIAKDLEDKNLIIIDKASVGKIMKVEKRFTFKDSKLVEARNYWTTGKFRWKAIGSDDWVSYSVGKATVEWQKFVKVAQARIPRIIYFPTFLFDLPNRIYLSKLKGEDSKNAYYRKIIENVITAIDPGYSIDRHVVSRVEDLLKGGDMGRLSNSDETADIDAAIRDIANEISRVIMGAWHEILGRDRLSQWVEISWGVDAANQNGVYIEIYLISGQHKYLLKERSLGFRWFFSFLLFTQFKRIDESERPTIFLFDEPAANLHSAAQTALLSSFEKVIGERDYLVYSTHSHYMVNPLWLERAYIVQNKAIDLLSDHENLALPVNNDIILAPYAKFVSDNPTRTTYFQPVLDALHYRLSPMLLDGPAVILEGKYDYYPFRYLLSRYFPDSELKCYSANGAGEMAILISMFRANDVPFVLLLDDDKAGRRERLRYKTDYHVSDSQVITIADADPELAEQAFEAIFGDDVLTLISHHNLEGPGQLKAKGSALFQLLSAIKDESAELDFTRDKFSNILEKTMSCLGAQA